MVLSPTSHTDPLLPRFADEIFLEIFEHLTDMDLLSLATISKHIHELSLVACFGRYGITEADIAAKSFPPLSKSQAFPTIPLGRFVTTVDALRLRFHTSTQLNRDVNALASLVRRMEPIKSTDLDFSPWPRRLQPNVIRCDMEALSLALVSPFRMRPIVVISPLVVTVVRPHRPPVNVVRRIFRRVRTSGNTEATIDEKAFRDALVIFTLMRAGRVIPSVSVRAFDPPAPLGAVIIIGAARIQNLRFARDLGLSPAEVSVILDNLNIPLLRSIDAEQRSIPENALSAFLCRHPTVQHLSLRGPPPMPPLRILPTSMPPDALPQLQHIIGSARLIAWVLASPDPFPQLVVTTIELYPAFGLPADYRAALHGLARRPTMDTLVLQFNGWTPWNEQEFTAPTAPERELQQVDDLRLTFRLPSRLPRSPAFIQWLRLFSSVRTVMLFGYVALDDWCVVLRKELPHIKFTSHVLSANNR
ncbi:hypothetical protein C8F04DRAFT_1125502 [Mycena alexandri]|uniref:F-box domain-containing protein n=1 Tax=Mycena alexandri TaxID=1745969 RepID=A0AAD6WVH9_9AGAR|nr:hypothetical protein C8F04DRAFT_1125502 [Mycena alexandri]